MSFISILHLLIVIASFILAIFLTFIVKKISYKYQIVDSSDDTGRKKHPGSIPLLGGWTIYLSSSIGILFSKWLGWFDFSRVSDPFIWAVLVGGLLIMIGGTLDDKYGLKPGAQIIWPLLATLIVILSGVSISYITNPIGGPQNAIIYLSPLVGAIISFIWLMGMMYTTKLLDGLDGLVSGITAIAALMIFLLSLSWDVPMSATGAWALALFGASAGFLLFNFHPAKIFLGEGGSLFVGFMLGVLSIISGSKIATTLLVIGIPALDVLWVMIRRLVKRQSPFSHADRKHLHFQLLDAGFAHREAVLFLYAIALAFGFLAVLGGSIGKLFSLLILVIVMFIIISTIYLKNTKNVSEK
jgi:UDP-GlcNAc:undecaprenyl-phosphate GlcNAc-1-phosphate transferase